MSESNIYKQINDLRTQNEELTGTLTDQNILFDKILVETHLLTDEEILKQYIAINAYLKMIVIQNAVNEIVG